MAGAHLLHCGGELRAIRGALCAVAAEAVWAAETVWTAEAVLTVLALLALLAMEAVSGPAAAVCDDGERWW